jgi:hypothetical protein
MGDASGCQASPTGPVALVAGLGSIASSVGDNKPEKSRLPVKVTVSEDARQSAQGRASRIIGHLDQAVVSIRAADHW